MKLNRIAAGAALALASTAALAVSGERWYGTNAGIVQGPEPIVVTRTVPEREYFYAYPEREVIVERRIVTPGPVVVERSYEVWPRDYVVTRPYDPIAALNPHTGPHLGQGLFPDKGPNDFGG